MYAIVEIAGQQFKVAKDQKVFVHRLSGNEGDKVTFNKVMLLDNGTITLGAPVIEGAAVVAKILGHLKGDKVIVFRKKRRKGFRKKNGHRQYFTQIVVEDIVVAELNAKKEETKAKVAKTDELATNVEVVDEAPKAEKKTTSKKKVDASDEEKPAKKTAAKKSTTTEE